MLPGMDRNAPPADLLRGLAETAACASAIGEQLSAAKLKASPKPEGWSANEILWHIRATADVHGEHIDRILNEDEPRWRHVSPRARMKKSRYDELPFAESLAAFAQQRADLVALLKGVEPEAWQRVALVFVPYYKREWRLTLHAQVWAMVDHEEGHCAQMEQVAAPSNQPAGRKAPSSRRRR
jgi:hypothetical protein